MGALIAASALGFAQNNAQASNYSDTPYYFDFASWKSNSYQQTADRQKQDNSSAYMHCDYVGGDYKYTGWVEVGSTDVSGGNYYSFGDNTTHYLTNYAYERYGSVNVHIKANIGFVPVEVYAGGLWSPDSV